MDKSPIYVTQPFLPPLEEFVESLEGIWKRRVLTNSGPLHQELEEKLAEHLGVKHVALFNNGTIALLTALQALRVGGEVITTPYSFVATAHSLLWNGAVPVFADVDSRTLNLDPKKIIDAITPSTTAIMPVHCYGNPCDVDAIQQIADNYNLKVIYDAAHAFGVEDDGGSILRHGDLSVLSFHATKVFNTFEGGAIVCPDAKTKQRIDRLKNFGFVDEVSVVASGINGKMSEVNSALGLLQLKYIDDVIDERARLSAGYTSAIDGISGLEPVLARAFKANYSYYPVLVGRDYRVSRDELYESLRRNNIYARRYFYPLISDFPMYRSAPSADRRNLENAANASDRVICLPLFPGMLDEDFQRVIDVLRDPV